MKASRFYTMVLSLCGATQASAQVRQIELGVTGSSKNQPGIAVLAGRGLDSMRTIVQRDLQNSDRFTVAPLGDSAGTLSVALDTVSMKGLTATGLSWIVELQPAGSGVAVKLWDMTTKTVRQQSVAAVDTRGVGETRITIHRVSDQVVNWTGGTGIAATRIAFKARNGTDDAIWRVDNDGANLVRVSRAGTGVVTATPAWSPDGSLLAYSEANEGRWILYLVKLATGTRTVVTSTGPGSVFGANFHPDGKTMVFSFSGPTGGSSIETVDIARNCCATERTHDRKNADNVSPSYSPDGRHIAYISNRTGTPQIWVMDDDGSNPEQQVPPEFDDRNHALDTYSPAWSPDGTKFVFARETRGGSRQVYKWSVGGGQAVQLTSRGRNEDPSWAPDSRHIVFKSNQTGREQLFIQDIESGTIRQIATPGDARFAAWSHVLGNNP